MIPVSQIEALTGLRALRLPMRRAFRIDLGFDLRTGHRKRFSNAAASPSTAATTPWLPPLNRVYPWWMSPTPIGLRQSGRSEADVLHTIQRWLDSGVLRRWRCRGAPP